MASTRQSAGNIRAFPWASLEAVRPDDIAALREVRGWCSRAVRLPLAATALGEIVGAEVRVALRHVQRGGRVRSLDDGVGIELALADSDDLGSGALLEADGALAAALVARALKRPPPRVTSPAQGPSPHVAGALAAVLVAAARSSHAGASLRILAAGPSAELARDFMQRARLFDVATFTILVDRDAYLGRLTVPSGSLPASREPWCREALLAMGDAEIELPIVAMASLAAPADLGRLDVGDAWMPGGWPLTISSSGAHAGPVWLAAADAEFGVRAVLGEHPRLVLGGGRETLAWSAATEAAGGEEKSMNEGSGNPPIVDAVGDVPVVVRVEIGSTRMRAREWAALSPGDVVALGRKVAEPVILRVGGAEIASGELVEIDGELGVRILTRRREESEA